MPDAFGSAGASGFLLKNAPPAQLVAAVRATAAGEGQIAPAIVRRMVEEFVCRPPPGTTRPAALSELTEREIDVLKLIARGPTNADIAGILFLSEATVRTHVSRILAKLELRDAPKPSSSHRKAASFNPVPSPRSRASRPVTRRSERQAPRWLDACAHPT